MSDVTTVEVLQAPTEVAVTEIQNTVTVSGVDPNQVVIQVPDAPNEVFISEVQNTVTIDQTDLTHVFVQSPGIQGPAGASILSGVGTPNNSIGKNGDHYINTSNGTLYGPKANNLWPNSPSFTLGSGVSLRYVHTQAVASTTWTIVHNLGTKPNVVILDSAGTHVIGDITYSSDNQIILSFSAAFSGAAYLS